MINPEEELTVRELIEETRALAEREGQPTITFDFEPEETGDYVMLVICVGKKARNDMARLLNTFTDYSGELE